LEEKEGEEVEKAWGTEIVEQIFHYEDDIYKYHSLWVRLRLS